MEHIKLISSSMYNALRLKYEAQKEEARTTKIQVLIDLIIFL